MSEWIKELILGVAVASLIGGAAFTIVEEKAQKEVLRIAVGLTIMLALAEPMLKLLRHDFSYEKAACFAGGFMDTEQMRKTNSDYAAYSLSAGVSDYVQQRAMQLGIDCSAKVSVAFDMHGTPVFEGVTVRYYAAEDAALEKLKRLLETECAIPQERQCYVKI